MKTKKAFTLIELLVVIAIIGILTTIAVISLNNARAKARDAKRIADMKQVQTALELFFNDRGRYPTDEEFATGSIYSTSTNSTSTYMQIIPSASNPPDGGCTSGQNTFYYSQNESGNSYTISFCLGGTTGSLAPGLKCLTPGGVLSVDCGPGGGGPPAFTCSDTVSYGGYDYPTVEIDSQCWLAENLNIGTQLCDTGTVCALEPDDTFDYNDIEKYCYGNNLANCTTMVDYTLGQKLSAYLINVKVLTILAMALLVFPLPILAIVITPIQPPLPDKVFAPKTGMFLVILSGLL
jgi:general secretion pathway protein G